VEIEFRDKILGGIPKAEKLIEPWLKSRGVPSKAAKELAEEIKQDVETVEDLVASAWTGFKIDETGPYIEERQVKALLKEAAFVLGLTKKARFKDSIAHGLFVKPERIHFFRDGNPVGKPDGSDESAIHVMTRRGPRAALKRSDYVERGSCMFEVWVAGPTITGKDLETLFTLGQEIGLGASRSQGYGKFDLKRFEPLQKKKRRKRLTSQARGPV